MSYLRNLVRQLELGTLDAHRARGEFGLIVKRALRRSDLPQKQLAAALKAHDPAGDEIKTKEAVVSRMINGDRVKYSVLTFTRDWLRQQAALEPLEEQQLDKLLAVIETRRAQSRPRRIWIMGGLIGAALLLALLVWLGRGGWPLSQSSGWQDVLDPREADWAEISATWIAVEPERMVLQEANPEADFGKVESVVISASTDHPLCLEVEASEIDLDTSYTVQILDKQTSAFKDVLTGITVPGRRMVNLSEPMGWQAGTFPTFTINLWISGEGRAATFVLIRVFECRDV